MRWVNLSVLLSHVQRPITNLTPGCSCQLLSSVRRRNCTTESLERTWPSARASGLTIKKRAREFAHCWCRKIRLPAASVITFHVRTPSTYLCTIQLLRATYLPTTILFDPAFSARTLDLPMKFKTIFDNIPALTWPPCNFDTYSWRKLDLTRPPSILVQTKTKTRYPFSIWAVFCFYLAVLS